MGRGRFQVLLALLRLSHAAAAPSRRHHGHSGHHLKNVTVRVRACDAPIKIANLGYLGPTKMNHLEYFSQAYAQPRYRSAAAPSAGAWAARDFYDYYSRKRLEHRRDARLPPQHPFISHPRAAAGRVTSAGARHVHDGGRLPRRELRHRVRPRGAVPRAPREEAGVTFIFAIDRRGVSRSTIYVLIIR